MRAAAAWLRRALGRALFGRCAWGAAGRLLLAYTGGMLVYGGLEGGDGRVWPGAALAALAVGWTALVHLREGGGA